MNLPNSKNRLYSVQQAAEYLGVASQTLRRWEARGILVPQRTKGNQRRYSLGQLERFKQRREVKSPDTAVSQSTIAGGRQAAGDSAQEAQNLFDVGVYHIGSLDSSPNPPQPSSQEVSLAEEKPTTPLYQSTTKAFKFPSFFSRARENNISIYKAGFSVLIVGIFLAIFSLLPLGKISLFKSFEKEPVIAGGNVSDVLASQNALSDFVFSVNIPSKFTKDVKITEGLDVDKLATFSGGIVTNNANGDFGTGIVIASNIPTVFLDSVVGGTGIVVNNADPRNPTISNTGVLSLQGSTGALTFSAGSGISLSGLTINNSGVTSLQGETGAVTLTAGSGIAISGTTISATAGSSQWTTNGTSIYYNNGNVGIGTTAPSQLFEISGGLGIVGQFSGRVIGGDAVNPNEFATLGQISSSQYWTRSAGGLYPTNITDDILIGGSSTSSALLSFSGTTGELRFDGDLALFKGAADRLDLSSGDRFNLVSGSFEIGGTSVITAGRLVQAADGSAANPAFTFSSENSTGLFRPGSGALAFSSLGAETMRIDTAGNLGIGTTVPLAKLDVNGSASVSGNLTFRTSATIQTTAKQNLTIGGASTGTIFFPSFQTCVLSTDASGALYCGSGGGGGGGITNIQEDDVNIVTSATVINFDGTDFAVTNPSAAKGSVAIDYASSGITRKNNAEVIGGQWSFLSDVLIGGTSTNSARFAFINAQGAGTPTASISGNITLNSAGNIQTTANQSLTLGGNTTGDIRLNDAVSFASSLTIGGDTITDFVGTGLQMNGTTLETTLGNSIDLTTEVTGILPIANGGTNTNTIGSAGSVAYSTGTAYAFTAVGTSGQILSSNGSGAPSWIDASVLGTNYWDQNNGTLYPKISSLDLLIGGTSTTSAKFAFINNASGTPTASIAGNIVLNNVGSLQTTNSRTLTVGGGTTGQVVLSGRNGSATGITFVGYTQGVLQPDANGVLSSAALNVGGGSSYVTGTLSVGNGGTGATTFTSNGVLFGNGTGTLQVTAAGTNGTVLKGNTGGAPTFGQVALTTDVSGVLPIANGGTNTNSLGSAGSVAYSTGSAYAFTAVGTSGQILTSNGSGAPTWADAASLGTNYWNQVNGTLYPKNSTVDLLIGGISSASAVFQVNATTGVITASTYNEGVAQFDTNGVISSAALNLAGGASYITGTLPVGNGGTGATSFTTNGILFGNNTGAIQVTSAAANSVLATDGSNVPGLTQTLPNAVQDNITRLGTITSGTWNGTAIGSQYGGTGQNFSSSTGVPYITLGTWATEAQLAVSRGGTNASSIGSAGSVAYSTGTAYAFSAVGTTGQVLISNGSSAPSWVNAASLGTNYWQRNLGAVSPLNITDDLLIGGTSTASAVFQVNATTGVITAASYGEGVLQSDANGVLSSAALNLAGGATFVTGVLPAGNGGTGDDTSAITGNPFIVGGDWQYETEVSPVRGGTGLDTSSATGVPYITSGTWATETRLAISRGGTNSTATPTQGGVAYGTGSAYAFTPAGTSGQILVSNGTAAPSWADASSVGTNYWQRNLGTLSPLNISDDLLIGGISSASAVFQVNATTGVITAANYGQGVAQFDTNGVLSSAALNLAGGSSYVTGTLPVGNGGTGATSFTTNGILFGNNTGALQVTSAAANSVLVTNGSNVPSLSTTLPNAVQDNITRLGTITSGTWNGSVIGSAYGGTGQDFSGSTGVVYVSGGTFATESQLAIARGGTNSTATPTQGGVAYGTGTAYAFSSAGNAGQVLMSNGTGAPSWTDAGGVGINYWNQLNGALSPKSLSADLLLGGSSTASAKFAFINNASGTPTASIAGNIVLNSVGSLQTTAAQTLTLGGSTTGQVVLSGRNGSSTGITLSGYGAGVLQPDANGVLSSAALNLAGGSSYVTGILPIANGGTNSNATPTAGGLAYGTGTAYAFTAAGQSGQCIVSGGTGAPVWDDCGAISGDDWNQLNGAIYPKNSTVDLLIGGTATASAKFAVLNIAAGTPVASLSATTSGLALSAGGSIQSLRNGTLTLGGDTTGNIVLSPQNGVLGARVAPNTNNQVDLGATGLAFRTIYAGTDVQVGGVSVCLADGTNCPAAGVNYWDQNNGTLYPKISSLDLLIGGSSTASAKFAFINNASGTPTASIAGNIVLNSVGSIQTTNSRTLTIGGATTGTLVLDSGTGLISLADNLTISGNITTGNSANTITGFGTIGTNGTTDFSGKNLSLTGTTTLGGVTYTWPGSDAALPGYVLSSNGSGTLSWIDVASATTNYWDQANGALYAKNTTVDFLLGGSATASAKFAFINVASGTPTASIAGNIVLNSVGNIQTTKGQTLTLGGSTTGQVVLSGRNGNATGITFSGYGAGVLQSDANGVISSAPLNLAGGSNFVTGLLPIANGGTNSNATPTQGGVAYGTGSAYAFTAAGNSGQILQSNGTGVPTWVDATTVGVNYWQLANGALAPLAVTNDLLLGGNSTASATIALGGTSGANSFINTGGNVGIGTTNPSSFLLEVAGNIGPDQNGTRDIGSPSRVWNAIYVNNIYPATSGTQGYWQRLPNTGSISTTNITDDVLIGGAATSSAKFAFINNASGTPTASIAGNIVLNSTGNLQTTNGRTLTIGGVTTGQVVLSGRNGSSTGVTLSGYGAGVLQPDANGVLSSAALNLAGGASYITGTLPVGNGGTGATSFTTNGILFGNNTGAIQVTSAAANSVLATDGSNVPGLTQTLPNAVQDNITRLGTITQGVWNGTVIGSAYGGTGDDTSAITGNPFIVGGDWQYETEVSPVRGGTGLDTSAATGVPYITSGTWATETRLAISRGGTNSTATPTQGGLAYGTGTAYAFTSAGTSGQVLTSNGTSAPSWTDPATLGTNYWNQVNGTLYPKNSTVDLLIGGISSASAVFQVNATTGVITAANYGEGVAQFDTNGVISSAALNLAGGASYITGTLPVGNGGTGATSFTTNGILFGNNTGAIQVTSAAANSVLATDGSNVPGLTQTLPNAVQDNITRLGTITSGTWNGTVIGSQYGGTGQNFSSTTGVPYISSGTWTTEAQLAISRGGTNSTATPTAGALAYGTGTAYAFSSAGTTGQCLLSGGTGAPTWGTCAGGTNYWTLNSGALTPINSTLDLLIGGTSTASAKFAFINNNSGTPTASIAGNIVLAGGTRSIQSTSGNTLTIGGSTTGQVVLSGRNGSSTGVTLSGYGAGVIQADANGILSSAALNLAGGSNYITGTLPIGNGGTGVSSVGSAGSIAYSDGTAYAFSSVGSSGQCLLSGGTGAPTWGTCAGGTNYWTLNSGALTPINSTLDLLVGGQSSASAKFAVLNMNSGTPVASLSATTTGLALDASGSLQSLRNGTLTLGGNTTGNIQFAPGNATAMTLLSNGNVGIGTTAPTSKLFVASTTAEGGSLTLQSGGATNFTLAALSPGSPSMAINPGGSNFGAQIKGINSGHLLLDLLNNDISDAIAFRYSAANTGTIDTIGFVMKGSGNVGVGTASPSALFNVINNGIAARGKALVNFTQYENQDIFTASASGVTRFTLGYNGTITASAYSTGVALFGSTGILSSGAIDLANSSYVSGILPVGNGGTGVNTFTANGIVYGNGASALQVTAAGTNGTVLKGNTGGAPTFGQVDLTTDVTGVLPIANGGTNTSSIGSAGSLAYSNGTSYAFTGVGSNGQCLQSAGSGTPVWGSCGGGTTQWDLINGALVPSYASTVDLLIGGTSTASAKFAVLNVNNGTPVASVSSGLNGTAAYLTADGSLQTAKKGTLNLGGLTTGDIKLAPNGTTTMTLTGGNVGIGDTTPDSPLEILNSSAAQLRLTHTDGVDDTTFAVDTNGDLTIDANATGGVGNVLLGDGDTLAIGGVAAGLTYNAISDSGGATGHGLSSDDDLFVEGDVEVDGTLFADGNIDTAFTEGSIVFAGTNGVLSENNSSFFWNNTTRKLGLGTATPLGLLHVTGNGTNNAAAIFNQTDSATSSDIFTASASGATRFTLGYNGTITASAYGTGVAQFSSTGVLSSTALNLAGGSSYVSGQLPIANGGTNTNSIGSAGSVAYSNGTAYAFSAVGTSGQCLTSGGTGVPTWAECATGANYWTAANGTLYSSNTTRDLLIGGTATTSAKFAVLNMNSGTPVASVSATSTGNAISLSGDGTIQTARNRNLVLGGSTTGAIQFAPNNTTTMTLANGNVGIGTTAPDSKFQVIQTMTDTSGFLNMGLNQLTTSPGGTSTATTIALWNRNLTGNGTSQDIAEIDGIYNEVVHRGTTGSDLALAIANSSNLKLTGAGTITQGYGNYINTQVSAAGTIGQAFGMYVNQPSLSNGGAVTTMIGAQIASLSNASNNLHLVLGDTVPSGNYGIYNSSTYNNYFAGNVGIGTTNPSSFKLQVAGNIGPNADNTYNLGASSSARFASLFVGPSSLHIQCTTGDGCGNTMDWSLAIPTSGAAKDSLQIGVNRSSFATGTPNLTLSTSGNVGIGTTTPSELLHLRKDQASPTKLAIQNTNGSGQEVFVMAGSSTQWNFGQTNSDGTFKISSDSNGSLDASTRLAINSSGNVGIGTTDPSSFKLQVAGSIGPNAAPTVTSSSQTITTVDSTSDVGQWTSTAVGTDGLPVVAFYDVTNANLKVLKCGNAACSSGNTITTVDSTGDVGRMTSIQVPDDGLPVISYYDLTNTSLKVAKCGNAACSSGNTLTTVDNTGTDTGAYSSIAIGTDGLPVISYYDVTGGDLEFAKCGNAACSSGNTLTTVDSTGNVGSYTSLTIGVDGFPIMSYYDTTNTNLKVAHCGTSDCSSGNTLSTIGITSNTAGFYSSIAIASDGLPIIPYYYVTGTSVRMVKCVDQYCSVGYDMSVQSGTTLTTPTSVMIDRDGTATVAFYNDTSDDLQVVKCGTVTCTYDAATSQAFTGEVTTVDSTGSVGNYPSVVLGADLLPFIAYYDVTNGDLKTVQCATTGCTQTAGSYYTGGSDIGSAIKFFNNVFAAKYWGDQVSINRFSDIAENYNIDGGAAKGDIVRAKSGTSLERTTKAYDEKVIGVVSTDPGITLGQETGSTPVALAGRVPVNISSASAPIEPGDYITTSDEEGKGMKATHAGMVVGVALEAWDPSDPDGQVLVFVNRGFHDPDLYVTSTGNISLIEQQDELAGLSRWTVKKDDNNEEVKRVGLFSDVLTASLSAGIVDAKEIRVNGVNILNLINTLGGQPASPSGSVLADGILQQVQDDIRSLKDQQAQTASETAFLRDIITSKGSVLGASDSASLDQAIANLDISGNTIVGHDLSVLGRTTLSDVGITGSLTAGIIGIDGLKGEINTVGEPLKIQSLSAAPVDFMDGKVVIETTGNIITKGTIKAKKLLIDEADASEKSVGEGTIEAGETTVVIETSAVSSTSKVFLTPTSEIDVPLVVSAKSAGNSFTVKISKTQSQDVKFNWFIVN